MEFYAEIKQNLDSIINKMTMEELKILLDYLQKNKGE